MMTAKELSIRRSKDFDFFLLCQLKSNMGMYELMRDRELDKYKGVRLEDMATQEEIDVGERD